MLTWAQVAEPQTNSYFTAMFDMSFEHCDVKLLSYCVHQPSRVHWLWR